MTSSPPIQRALISVSDKTHLVALASHLHTSGVEILSTGGTARAIEAAGIPVVDVSTHTGFPEIMDGRVKTLQPAIHGGILARRDQPDHLEAMQTHQIAPIDLVVVNLYPFEETIAGQPEYEEAIEQIDIGGPAMIRAAAKNHQHVTVVVDPADYDALMEAMQAEGGTTSLALRQSLAAKAFARTAAYDSAISRWFMGHTVAKDWPDYVLDGTCVKQLRYGENPHQSAAVYASAQAGAGVVGAEQLQGKALSYNNINDTDAAFKLVQEFDAPAIAIIKHANPSGVAIGADLAAAYAKALACDPVSAFGGILAANRAVDAVLVEAIGALFLEVIIAPAITEEAAAMLAKKKNLRVLITGDKAPARNHWQIKSVSGGYLLQQPDAALFDEAALQSVAVRAPSEAEMRDLCFAFAVCKHVKSNAIVLAKDGATIGIGAGQMSRVDSVRLACQKAEAAGLSTEGTVLASDAFFPFDDNVHHAAEAGVRALIHPGGSIRDAEVIAAANQYDMAMLVTGMRHFNH